MKCLICKIDDEGRGRMDIGACLCCSYCYKQIELKIRESLIWKNDRISFNAKKGVINLLKQGKINPPCKSRILIVVNKSKIRHLEKRPFLACLFL